MAQKLIPPPTMVPISTSSGSLTTPWGNYFTLLSNNLQDGGNYAPSSAQYVLNQGDQTGTLQSGQVLANLSSGFVKVVTSSGQLESTGSNQIQAIDLTNTGVTAGTYGSATAVSVITVDAQGRIDSATTTPILGAAPTGPAGGDLTGSYPNPVVHTLNGVAFAPSATTDTTNASNITSGTLGTSRLTGTYSINVSGNASTVTTNANLTGPVTSTGNATTIANGAITNAMIANTAVANLSGVNTGDQTNISGNAATVTTNANMTGDVTSIGNATTYNNNLPVAKLASGTGATANSFFRGDNSWAIPLFAGYKINNIGNSTYTLLATDKFSIIESTNTGAGQALNLVAASTFNLCDIIVVVNNGTNSLAVVPHGLDTISGSPSNRTITPGETVAFIVNSTANWNVLFDSATGPGTVSSVSFTGDGVIFSNTAGTPVTSSGTLTPTLNAVGSSYFLVGPPGSGVPTYRRITTTDLATGAGTLGTSVYLRGDMTWGAPATAAGRLLGITRVTSSGSFTLNSSTQTVIFDVVGAGGASGSVTAALGSGTWNTVGGGGAGGRVQCLLTAAQAGAVFSITIGAGGTGGSAGGLTTIGASVGSIIAHGGIGSPTSQNLGGSFTFDTAGAGGAVGTSQGITLINLPGQAGVPGLSGGTTTQGYSGAGGSTVYGIGGASITSGSAQAGVGFGAGGGGGIANGTTASGADGAPAVVYIYEYS